MSESSEILGIADAFLPNFDRAQDKKRLYLSYRLCGFGRDEAIDLAGISRRTLYHWRQKDPEFDAVEKKTLPELRKMFTREFVFWQHMRLQRQIMELDGRILDKALDDRNSLTRREWALLITIMKAHLDKQIPG